MRQHRFLMLSVAVLAAAWSASADTPPGFVVPPAQGERIRCGDSHALTIQLRRPDALPRLLAGTGRVEGTSELRAHEAAEEIVHVTRGWGRVLAGDAEIPVGPGSVVHIPAGTTRQFVSTGAGALEYFFTLSDGTADPCGSIRPLGTGEGATAIEPGAGDRIFYCLFPLTITAKIDADSSPLASLTAAVGQLRAGIEDATHDSLDEIVYITRGRALAIVGEARIPVEPGSLVVTPRGNYHGFINEGSDTLDYVIVFSGPAPRAAFRKLAERRGPYCPDQPRIPGSAPPAPAPATAADRPAGYVVAPAGGEPLVFCDSPELTANIKVSPATTGDAPLAVGTAELSSGSNFGTHRDEDEVIYFLSGRGSVVIGDKTSKVQPGTTLYVPRGVRHGFIHEGAEPLRFLWAIAPPGLEERFRAGGHPPGFDCTAEAAK